MTQAGRPERLAAGVGAIPGGVAEVARLAYPVVLHNLSHTLLQVVDMAFVARLGPTEMAAVGFAGIWYWTAVCFFVGTATGVQTFVAREHGAGREERCGRWVWQAALPLVPLAALGLVAFAALFPWLLDLLDPAPEIRDPAGAYVALRAFGAPAVPLAIAAASFFRGLSDMRTPLAVGVACNLVNAGLDYGLIFGELGLPALGVRGAALATAVSDWLMAAGMLGFLLAPRRRRAFDTGPVRPDRRSVRRLLRVGLPIGGQWLLDMITFALFTSLIARMGSADLAASQALVTLLHLSFMQVVGVSVAATTLVGRYLGAGEPAAAERSFRSAHKLGAGVAALVGAAFLVWPEELLALFAARGEVLEVGVPLLAVGALFQVFDALAIVTSGALRGAGDTGWPFAVQTGMAWGLFLPFAWAGGVLLGGGLLGAWAGAAAYLALLALVLAVRFRSGVWKRIEI